jgi:hypothetical protein
MALVSYFIALMIGLAGISYLIAVVAFKTALYFMTKSGEDDNN